MKKLKVIKEDEEILFINIRRNSWIKKVNTVLGHIFQQFSVFPSFACLINFIIYNISVRTVNSETSWIQAIYVIIVGNKIFCWSNNNIFSDGVPKARTYLGYCSIMLNVHLIDCKVNESVLILQVKPNHIVNNDNVSNVNDNSNRWQL